MSEYGFRKIPPRNPFRCHESEYPEPGQWSKQRHPRAANCSDPDFRMCKRGGGREVPDYRSTFSADQRFLEGIQSCKCGSIRIATTFLSGTVASELVRLEVNWSKLLRT